MKSFRPITLPIILVTLLNSCSEKVEDSVVVRSLHFKILESELNARTAPLLEHREAAGLSTSPHAAFLLKEQSLERLIQEKLLEHQAQKLNLNGLDQKVADEWSRLKQTFPSEEAFQKHLSSQGKSQEVAKAEVKLHVLEREVVNEMMPDDIAPTEEEMLQYYEGTSNMWVTPQSSLTAHIWVKRTEKTTDPEWNALQQSLQTVRGELVSTSNSNLFIKELKRRFPETGVYGDFTRFTSSTYPEVVAEQALEMEEGQVSPIIPNGESFHCIKVLSKEKARAKIFLQVRGEVRELILKQRKEKARRQILDQLKKMGSLSIYLHPPTEIKN